MKVKYATFIFTLVLCFVMIFNMVFLAVDGLGGGLKNLPEGKKVSTHLSASREKTLNMYTASLSGVGVAVRGEVVFKDGTTKNVYWCIGETKTNAFWVNEKTVMINGHYININGEAFDSRTRIELPEASYKNLASGN